MAAGVTASLPDAAWADEYAGIGYNYTAPHESRPRCFVSQIDLRAPFPLLASTEGTFGRRRFGLAALEMNGISEFVIEHFDDLGCVREHRRRVRAKELGTLLRPEGLVGLSCATLSSFWHLVS